MTKIPKPPFPHQPITPPGIEAKMNPKPHYKAEAYKPAGKLKNKVALISGGDSGIGRSVALLYAREGADVALVFLPEEKQDAEKIKNEIEALGRKVLLIPGDLKQPEFCEEVVAKTMEHFKKIDILVNNAAFQKHQPNLDALSIEQWDHTFTSNIYNYYYLTKFSVPHMKPGSVIINTGSITGLEGSKELLDYASTKGAIHAFTKSLAKNLLDKGIRVNCVAPGPVWTPLNPAERKDKAIKDFGSDTAIGRPAQPEELAPAYVFLASNADSGYISGLILPVLGGNTIAG
ncbi:MULTISPECIES: SDR family oxidoreductase [Legionella]|uniref:Acetyoacetyl CoA reductase n=1 Tax=Legionella drozanskii LLAP-1 TaxID=1212489 RepID=A0A0W0SWC6_9GAMM|nr:MULTISPECIES: SDR family oxidoreductase [Legionella]KTC87694.1 acetyoacetyl CoA reductase [Legionella drozanskii LLAP-1]PJE16228.1 MAG: short-chain dehydrogenase [Legionella sp.]